MAINKWSSLSEGFSHFNLFCPTTHSGDRSSPVLVSSGSSGSRLWSWTSHLEIMQHTYSYIPPPSPSWPPLCGVQKRLTFYGRWETHLPFSSGSGNVLLLTLQLGKRVKGRESDVCGPIQGTWVTRTVVEEALCGLSHWGKAAVSFGNHNEYAQSFANSQKSLSDSDFRESKQSATSPKKEEARWPPAHSDTRSLHKNLGDCGLGLPVPQTNSTPSPPPVGFPQKSILDSVPDPWLVSNSLILWTIIDNDGNIFSTLCAFVLMSSAEIS